MLSAPVSCIVHIAVTLSPWMLSAPVSCIVHIAVTLSPWMLSAPVSCIVHIAVTLSPWMLSAPVSCIVHIAVALSPWMLSAPVRLYRPHSSYPVSLDAVSSCQLYRPHSSYPVSLDAVSSCQLYRPHSSDPLSPWMLSAPVSCIVQIAVALSPCTPSLLPPPPLPDPWSIPPSPCLILSHTGQGRPTSTPLGEQSLTRPLVSWERGPVITHPPARLNLYWVHKCWKVELCRPRPVHVLPISALPPRVPWERWPSPLQGCVAQENQISFVIR